MYSDINAVNCSKYYEYQEMENLFKNCISDLTISAHNIRSVRKNFDELYNDMSDFNFHVTALNKTR